MLLIQYLLSGFKIVLRKMRNPYRDRIVERFAMLLSQAAGTNADDAETDESRVCGSPGKVLDAALLQQLLCEIQPQHQLFYGPSKKINFDRRSLPKLNCFFLQARHRGAARRIPGISKWPSSTKVAPDRCYCGSDFFRRRCSSLFHQMCAT